MKEIRVLVNGAQGRMGQEAVKAISLEDGLQLVGQADINDDLSAKIQETAAQVVVDFTTAAIGFENAKLIIANHTHPVIGTSGFFPEQVQQLQKMCAEQQLGGLIAPNFAIGAVLMMKYAQDAAKYLPYVEIIELHHDRKADAPSGTAIKTANLIAQTRSEKPKKKVTEKEVIAGVRGGNMENIQIHSVRLPGLVAHQEVIFGGISETLTIRHDSIHRESFMPGVCFACKKVVECKELYSGLEQIL